MSTNIRPLLWVLFSLIALTACHNESSDSSEAVPGAAPSATTSRWTTLGTRAAPAQPNRPVTQNAAAQWVDYDPPALHASSVKQENILLPMDDGVGISLDLVRPDLENGGPAPEPLPTIVTFTPYNKNFGDTVPLGGAINEYFVLHGLQPCAG